ncbi:MAG: hypothetical protein AAF702_37250 [Chloroflexota bacterium]
MMIKHIRQFMLTIFMVSVLLSVTTLTTHAASWHASNTHYWIVQNACPTHIEVIAAWNAGNLFPPPVTYEWEGYSWLDDSPAGPVVSDEPTWVPASDQLFDSLGSVDVTIENQPTPIVFEPLPGVFQRTDIWGSEIINWGTPLEVGTGVFVRHPWSTHGFVIAVQACDS